MITLPVYTANLRSTLEKNKTNLSNTHKLKQMKKTVLLMLCSIVFMCSTKAQSKVFKEVGEGISTQFKTIVQDNALVGYLVFTELEKASEDSFNYRINIMDENLNDIGTVNFREEKLLLGDVAFDQDVLCLAYFKSNTLGKEFKNLKAYNKAGLVDSNYVFTQFLNLDGKIIKTNSIPVDIKNGTYTSDKTRITGGLKKGIQLTNVPDKGFVCFYGENSKNDLVTFNASGNQVWKKQLDDADNFFVLASKEDIYVLAKHKDSDNPLGGWDLRGYGFSDSAVYDKYSLQDQQGNSLTVSGFGNDPITGHPYLSGQIINEERRQKFGRAKDIWRGLYSGVYTLNVNGHKKNDITSVYSYWSDGSQSDVFTIKGRFVENKAYGNYYQSFRDYQGNTYFTGTKLIKHIKWGAVTCAVIFSPFIYPPILIFSGGGSTSARATDAILVKQSPKGSLSLETSVTSNEDRKGPAKYSIIDSKKFYTVTNSAIKTNYLIVDDQKNINIYNVAQQKIVRTIPHKDGKLRVNIYPAKEGSIMVSEYDAKEKYTRYSIEAL